MSAVGVSGQPRRGGRPVLHRPRALHQLEGLTVLVISVALYARTGQSWLLLAALFFAPDLALLAYAFSNSAATTLYNLMHTYTLPALLGAIGVLAPQPLLLAVALIWAAHIGFDRTLGLGLRTPDAFGHAQLRKIGRSAV